jgi:hypothetical protein
MTATRRPPGPVVRYQRQGKLVPIDIKKLGRIAGIGHRVTGRCPAWPTAIAASAGNTCTSPSMTPRALAYAKILPDTCKASAFVQRALARFARHEVTVVRTMTGNDSAYRSPDIASSTCSDCSRA